MTEQEYAALEKLIRNVIGVRLNTSRKNFIENLLIRRLKFLGLQNFNAYYDFVKQDDSEMMLLINLVTNRSTGFFREHHHFEYMAKQILPNLFLSQQKVRLWSAGCSSGEEPYSIAITLIETVPDFKKYDIKILATDINTDALETARLGVYDQSCEKKLTSHKRFFEEAQENNLIKVKIKEKVKELVTFKKLNLLDDWPMKNPFDVIFCRNVTIYLSPEVTEQLFERFDQQLKPGGFLILGHSENLNIFQDRYVCLGNTIYKKVI